MWVKVNQLKSSCLGSSAFTFFVRVGFLLLLSRIFPHKPFILTWTNRSDIMIYRWEIKLEDCIPQSRSNCY